MPVPIYALLIGAEFYFPNRTAQGTIFKSLQGCVRDITRVETELLIGRLKVPPERILKLKASNTGAKKPPEPPEEWPTYENINAKFDELIAMAQPRSQVYIHYSGHGGRATSIWKELKGPAGIDETIVPINIEDLAASRYLRDLELARLLRKMVDKELVVTLVLDCCHSGGMTRGGGQDIAVRGTARVDTRERPLDAEPSRVASRDELIANWRTMVAAAPVTRSVKAKSGWLPEPKGYVMLAACKETELAIEFAFNGTNRCGVLTHWMLNALQDLGPHTSWKHVHDRVLAKINSQFVQQTPQLEGETGRRVFGLDQVPPVYAVRVLQFDKPNERVELNTGQALGTALNAGYAIFPAHTVDFTKSEHRLAVAKITTLGGTKSWAKITESVPNLNLQGGEQALIVDSGLASLRGRVRLVKEVPPPPVAEREAALSAIEEAIRQSGQGFLKIVDQNEATNYQVAVSKAGAYEILDAQGQPYLNLRPVVQINDPNAAETIVARLKHLYKFHTVEQLKNPDIFSPLAGLFIVEAFKAPAGAQSSNAPPAEPPEPLIGPDGQRSIAVDEKFYLHVKNNSALNLNVAMLDLDSDWSIAQALPPANVGSDTFPLAKNEEKWFVFTARLAKEYDKGFEILKFFAALGPASFRFLELPALDQPFVSLRTRGKATTNVLEQLMAEFNDDTRRTRSVELEVAASSEWIVAEVALRIYRPQPPE